MSLETDRIVQSYRRRQGIPVDRYSVLNPCVNLMLQERQRALINIFELIGLSCLDDTSILEVGCGAGDNLLDLIRMGASPANLVGNDLIEKRLLVARDRLPRSVRLLQGDAVQLELPEVFFDIVYQSTVFSSILDDDMQVALAKKMWSLVKPGGGIIWYDFAYNNPHNPDVRGVPIGRIKELFPFAKSQFYRVTLAPPIARRLVQLSPHLYALFNFFPFLRTHVLCYLEKV